MTSTLTKPFMARHFVVSSRALLLRHVTKREFRIASSLANQQRYKNSFRYLSTWNWSKEVKKPDTSEGGINSSNSNSNISPNDTNNDVISNEVHQSIITQVTQLHSSIMPLNTTLSGPLAKNSDRGTSLPFVFLVGNHSSGKSSFINYVVGRSIQTAGVAPTDDCFTVIAPGPKDVDQDGPALVGDPDIGFEGLRQFGPTLIHHAQLKDSPGMIDSPVSSGGMSMGFSSIGKNLTDSNSHSGSTSHAVMDRGYDFQGVVRWFAERADVVLLFFDPDKPGTTGETLSILLHSLGGMDHKLLIVLNKADQFKKIHDFARAYGSLCWNLSKVIPRKDLPRIFTMCLPVKKDENNESTNNTPELALDQRALADLHQTRDDVVAEVMKAPKRRIDNVITNLHDSVHLLLMHATVAEDVRSRFSKRQWENRIQEFASLSAGVGLAALSFHFSVPPQFTGGVVAATIVGVGGLHWFNASRLKDVEEQLLSVEELSASFQRTHPGEVNTADEFYASVWARVRDPLRLSLWRTGLKDFAAVRKSDIHQLQNILDVEIPRLRRLASPSHHGSKKDS
eukprot:scaffold396239_cov56-Cyclotella_meneghiniana.AAC.2